MKLHVLEIFSWLVHVEKGNTPKNTLAIGLRVAFGAFVAGCVGYVLSNKSETTDIFGAVTHNETSDVTNSIVTLTPIGIYLLFGLLIATRHNK